MKTIGAAMSLVILISILFAVSMESRNKTAELEKMFPKGSVIRSQEKDKNTAPDLVVVSSKIDENGEAVVEVIAKTTDSQFMTVNAMTLKILNYKKI